MPNISCHCSNHLPFQWLRIPEGTLIMEPTSKSLVDALAVPSADSQGPHVNNSCSINQIVPFMSGSMQYCSLSLQRRKCALRCSSTWISSKTVQVQLRHGTKGYKREMSESVKRVVMRTPKVGTLFRVLHRQNWWPLLVIHTQMLNVHRSR